MNHATNTKRALLTGYFSTVEDIESLDIVRDRLGGVGMSYDMAPFKEMVREKMRNLISMAEIDPGNYNYLVIICGPVWKKQLEKVPLKLSRFKHCVCIGMNLTRVEPLHV